MCWGYLTASMKNFKSGVDSRGGTQVRGGNPPFPRVLYENQYCICWAESMDLRNPFHGLRCTNHGSILCAGNPWIACTCTSQFLNIYLNKNKKILFF